MSLIQSKFPDVLKKRTGLERKRYEHVHKFATSSKRCQKNYKTDFRTVQERETIVDELKNLLEHVDEIVALCSKLLITK